jgi:hypothetical protein
MRWLSISASFRQEASVRRRPVPYQQQQDRAVAEVGRRFDQLRDFLRTEHHRELLRAFPQTDVVELRIVSLQGLLEEKPQSGQAIGDGARGQFLVAQHVQLKLANLFGTQLIG